MGDTESLVKERSRVLAEQNGWSLIYADAYVKGEYDRRRGKSLGVYVAVALDEYSLGFRAGYFGRQRPASPQGGTTDKRETEPEVLQSK